jgi:large conductance mechanosensitive channel
MFRGFKDFVFRSNVVDLAVAFVICDLIRKGGRHVGKRDRDSDHQRISGASVNGWGFSLRGGGLKSKTFIDISTLINSLIVFILTAAIIYAILVVPNQRLRVRRGVPPAPPTEVDMLTEIRDLLAGQQAGRSAP